MSPAGSTAKKAGRRRISFRPQPGDSDNQQNGSEHDEVDVEMQGGAEPALSADNIEEDAAPSPSAPSSGMHQHSQLNSSVVYQLYGITCM